MKAKEEVEHMGRVDLIQASTKDEIESAIMKNNLGRFRLVHFPPLLEGDICSQLGMSGE